MFDGPLNHDKNGEVVVKEKIRWFIIIIVYSTFLQHKLNYKADH